MIGSELDGYRLVEELGAGGMGTVYLAERDGEKVALKVIHPHLLATSGFFKRFLREAELGRKVTHKNVVRTLDVDATLVGDKQVNYMVMEYVEGKHLRNLLQDLGSLPETLLREIALQTAAGLAAIHEAGIVHRDLKLENIMITDDEEVRIMDLGVAKLQEASIAITKEGQFAGSLLYAAPEQFRSEDVGPSSDQYSLGVVLYELATGENPFRRDDAAMVIQAHLQHQPPRVTDLNDSITAFFAEVVKTLIAKGPAERFRDAPGLRDVIREAEASQWWAEREPQIRKQESALPRIRVRRDTELHGRDADLALLRRCFALAAEGKGNTVLVEGEAGIGKTRLIDAFLRTVEDESPHVLYGSYPPSGGLGAISDSILEKFGNTDLTGALTSYLTETPSLIPGFAALVKHETAPSGSEPISGEALHTVGVHLMRALGREKPTIWVLEDLHFASRDSRDFVLALARAVEGHKVLLVSSSRESLPDDEGAHFSRLDNFQRIALQRLGARDVLELLQDAFKSRALAEKLGGKIAFKSDGVPFFVFEMIRGLKEGQFIRLTDDGTYVQTEVISEIEVPSAVKDLIEGRLRGLSETQRAILDVGAVQGLTFEPGLVAAVLEEKRVRVLRDLAEIERRFGLVRDDGHAVRFDQNQIQEVLYRGLTPHLRAEYHTLIAEEKDDADAYFLALHQLRGARPKGAAPHVEGALKFLKDSHRHEETVTLADLALATPELLEGEQRVEVLLEKAHALYTTKRGDEVAAVLEEARALADTPRLQAKVMLSVAWNRRVAGDAAGALEAVHEARALAGEDRELVTRGYVAEAGTLMNLSRYREALEVFRLAQESPDAHVRADAQRSIATCQFYLGNRKRAHQGYLAALESYRELGDKHGECLAGNLLLSFESDPVRRREQAESLLRVARETGHRQGENWGLFWLATIHWDDGNWAEALAYRLRNLALCRELGDRVGQGIGLVNCGPLYANLGDTRRARGMLEESLAISREVGVPRPESYGLHYLGDLAEQEGRFDDARRLHEEGLALREKTEFALGIVESSAALGLLLCRHGETEAGRVHLERGLQLGREQGLKPQVASCLAALAAYGDGDAAAALAYATEHDAEIDVAHRMHVRRLLWKATGDRGHLEEAYQLLTHLRDHAPEEYRESMIENVPLHKEIMEAWRDR